MGKKAGKLRRKSRHSSSADPDQIKVDSSFTKTRSPAKRKSSSGQWKVSKFHKVSDDQGVDDVEDIESHDDGGSMLDKQQDDDPKQTEEVKQKNRSDKKLKSKSKDNLFSLESVSELKRKVTEESDEHTEMIAERTVEDDDGKQGETSKTDVKGESNVQTHNSNPIGGEEEKKEALFKKKKSKGNYRKRSHNDTLEANVSEETENSSEQSQPSEEKVPRQEFIPEKNLEVKKKARKCELYKVPDKDEVLVLLKHPHQFSFTGKAEVQVIWGSINVVGYKMTHTSLERYPVYSPYTHAFITLHTEDIDEHSSTELCLNAVHSYIGHVEDQHKLDNFLEKIKRRTVVLSFSKLDEAHLDYLTSFKQFSEIFPSCSVYKYSNALKQIGVHPIECDEQYSTATLQTSIEYKCALQEIVSEMEEGAASLVTIVCGGKNVGKSTMNRFLVNSLLNHCKEVALLDCDLGQTEMTLPGCVSLHLIRDPLLGPPFTHQRAAERSCYVGAVTPAQDPDLYITCLRYVYEAYLQLPQKPPLVVNTMGWNKGMGVHLLVETMRMVEPDTVLQIDSTSLGRNFPQLTNQFIDESRGWIPANSDDYSLTSNVDTIDKHVIRARKPHRLFQIQSLVDPQKECLDRYNAKNHRTMSVLSYFGHMYDNVRVDDGCLASINSLTPYRMNWTQLALNIIHSEVPNTHILLALNASVVALCHLPQHAMFKPSTPDNDNIINENNNQTVETAKSTVDDSETTDGVPYFLTTQPVYNCIGFGIVRAIEPETHSIYVLSSLDESEMCKVNCLVKGSLELPSVMLINQSSSSNPYVGEAKDVMGVMQRRKHLQRRRSSGPPPSSVNV